MKGWEKGSPVDCFVISPELELKGSLTLNQFLDHALAGAEQQQKITDCSSLKP